MPAIQPARLKQQAAMLAQHFGNPDAYVRSLHYLLDLYADRSLRPGQSGEPASLVSAYNVPSPALRLILRPLLSMIADGPEDALALADALWKEPVLEFRLLAADLLGQIPTRFADEIADRIERWAGDESDAQLVNKLLEAGLSGLRRDRPTLVIGLVEGWLNSEAINRQRLGLRALLPILSGPGFENMPVFFRMLQPFCRKIPPGARPDLLDVFTVLVRRSPAETAFFLRQNMEIPGSRDTPWLTRQLLREFPAENQSSLRQALRANEQAQG